MNCYKSNEFLFRYATGNFNQISRKVVDSPTMPVSLSPAQRQSTVLIRQKYEQEITSWILDSTEKTPINVKRSIRTKLLECFDNKTLCLRLVNEGLCSVPPITFLDHLQEVVLEGNFIKELPPHAFRHLKDLRILHLSGNEIRKIQDFNLSGLIYLQSLSLSFNNMEEIVNLNMMGCLRLSELDLTSGNQIKTIKRLDLSHCINLKTLYFNYTSLETLSHLNCTGCVGLAHINLHHNKLTNLGVAELDFCGLLNSIDLSNNQLEAFPNWDLTVCPDLHYVSLRSNNISEMDFLFLTETVKLLDLSRNRLVGLHESLYNLQNRFLRVDLQNNCFSPETIANINARLRYEPTPNLSIQLSIYSPINRPESLTVLFDVLKKWNQDPNHPLWESIAQTPQIDSNYTIYFDFLLFLSRLFGETPREQDGITIPDNIQRHVKNLLSILEDSWPDQTLFLSCCGIFKEYLETCTDKLAVGMLYVLLHAKKSVAESTGCVEELASLNNDLKWIEKTISFINDLNECKVVFVQGASEFRPMNQIFPRTFNVNGYELDINQITELDRIAIYLTEKEGGKDIHWLKVHDDVEDILLLLNRLKKNKLLSIDGINMKFKNCATLKSELHQSAAIRYLKSVTHL